MTEQVESTRALTFTGYVSIAGVVSMFVGAAFSGASGTDLWQALANNQMESYLDKLAPVRQILVAGTTFWTLGVLLLGIAGGLMASLSKSNLGSAHVALALTRSAVPIAVVSFITMLSLAMYTPDAEAAATIGWIGTRLDDIATLLIAGTVPFFLSLSGRKDWVPGWLGKWGYLVGLTGIISIIGILTSMNALGFIAIPVGFGWMVAAGVVLIKKA